MIHHQGREIHDQTLNIGKDDAYYLGPDLRLVDCRVVLATDARALTISGVVFERCEITARHKLTGFRWYYAFLKRCRFSGTFASCDFGHWPEDAPNIGGIEECDFSSSTLDGCRFLDCDASRISFPKWPCFTILDPVRNVTALSSAPWPGRTGIPAKTFASFPVETAAVTYDATQLIKRYGGSIDELRSVLLQLDAVM